MHINYNDLEMAVDYVSADQISDHEAYICRATGKIYYEMDDQDLDPLPPDLDVEGRYLLVPSKHDLNLGSHVALDFAAQYLSDDLETVYAYFRKSGAYSKFKALLERRGFLDQWYAYEQSAVRKALLEWCSENAVEVMDT